MQNSNATPTTHTATDLRNLCIRHNWFTGGDVRQYEKLFQRADEGATNEELALIIWLCSDADRDEILAILNGQTKAEQQIERS